MTLSLFLMRHGAAQGGGGIPDGERALTDSGACSVRAVAAKLADRGTRLDLALASPLRRAQQTAEIVWRAVGAVGPIQTVAALSPSGTATSIVDAIAEERLVAPTARSILLVSHMPVIGELAGYLGALGGGGGLFSPGELRWIEFADVLRPGRGELREVLPPG